MKSKNLISFYFGLIIGIFIALAVAFPLKSFGAELSDYGLCTKRDKCMRCGKYLLVHPNHRTMTLVETKIVGAERLYWVIRLERFGKGFWANHKRHLAIGHGYLYDWRFPNSTIRYKCKEVL